MSRPIKSEAGSPVRVWRPIMAVTTWLTAAFCSFVTFPIKISSQSDFDGTVFTSANIMVAITVGLLTALGKTQLANSRNFWFIVSILCTLIFLSSFSLFFYLRTEWTCQYTPDVRLVVGSTPSTDLQEYLAQQPAGYINSCTTLLSDYAGETERMFSLNELVSRYIILSLLFFSVWITVAAVVISIAFALSSRKSGKFWRRKS